MTVCCASDSAEGFILVRNRPTPPDLLVIGPQNQPQRQTAHEDASGTKATAFQLTIAAYGSNPMPIPRVVTKA